MRGALWPLRKAIRYEDLFARRIVVYRNTFAAPINRPEQADYIWMIEDRKTGEKLARATEVPLVGAPIKFLPGPNLAVVGSIPPGQLVLKDAQQLLARDWARMRPKAVILTSDGEIWTATGRAPAVKHYVR